MTKQHMFIIENNHQKVGQSFFHLSFYFYFLLRVDLKTKFNFFTKSKDIFKIVERLQQLYKCRFNGYGNFINAVRTVIFSLIPSNNHEYTACGQKWFRFRHLPYIFHIKPFIFITPNIYWVILKSARDSPRPPGDWK
jgi:hypothetical protein